MEITDDSAALPPDVVEVKEGVGMSDSDQQRVVITSDVVDALLEGKPENADTSNIDNLVEKLCSSNYSRLQHLHRQWILNNLHQQSLKLHQRRTHLKSKITFTFCT